MVMQDFGAMLRRTPTGSQDEPNEGAATGAAAKAPEGRA